ncbi:Hypothetical predicted protein, partial [Olea europaea subsp. europaea]
RIYHWQYLLVNTALREIKNGKLDIKQEESDEVVDDQFLQFGGEELTSLLCLLDGPEGATKLPLGSLAENKPSGEECFSWECFKIITEASSFISVLPGLIATQVLTRRNPINNK